MATGRFDLLRVLTVDRLHEPYRAAAFPQLPRLVQAARDAGAIGACLSGAGSTVIAFSDSVRTITRIEGAFTAGAADTDLPGRIVVVSPRNQGAQVLDRALTSRGRRGPRQVCARMNPSDLRPGLSDPRELGGLAVEEAVRRVRIGDEPWSTPARSSAASNSSIAAGGMPASAPPNRPRIGDAI